MARRESRGAPRRTNARQYPRTARLNQLMREIVAEALEHIDDERLDLLTVTAVEVEPDLRHALVLYDSLQGVEGDEEVLEALADQRKVLQAAIGRQARIKRTPELTFAPDPAVRQGARVETLLAEVAPGAVEVVVDPDLYGREAGPADPVDPDLANG
jgi:ribosome-binding factor A